MTTSFGCVVLLTSSTIFFPGRGVEFTESAEDALRRELKEELGMNLLKATFIGAAQNFFEEKGKPHH